MEPTQVSSGRVTADTSDRFDVIIVGAGISGINFAYRLQERLPHLSYTILDARYALGGTWDLFKYPGIRSDSDLYTFGFPWRPWTESKCIAEGPLIKKYIEESAAEHGIDKKVRFGHRANGASWSSKTGLWTLDVDAEGTRKDFFAQYVFMCTGYYDYKTPLQATIPGLENFEGKVVHPQFWPEDLDYTGKNVVVIGSGATAITLVPAMAKDAGHVTMLQRSPSFVLSQPTEDGIERGIRKYFPTWMGRKMIRFKWLLIPWLFVNFCRYWPQAARKMLRKETIAQLPESISADPHFNPSYNPFQQRMCFCPDGDFYASLRSEKADIVTGTIKTVTKNTIELSDGQILKPDIIVTATGLKIQFAGGMPVVVDGSTVHFREKFLWKNVMLQDIPNLFYVIGYVNASWTLGADATARLVCRMLKSMERKKATIVVPRITEQEREKMKELPVMNLTSTYVRRAKDVLPKAADHPQWRGRTSFFKDNWEAWFGDITTGLLYTRAG
jgi:cation diffusion facilitator CzcD-associated flavoprotein CzcO